MENTLAAAVKDLFMMAVMDEIAHGSTALDDGADSLHLADHHTTQHTYTHTLTVRRLL